MSLLLPYQKQLISLLDRHQVVVCEKSRRIGMTWAAAAYAVVCAARQRSAGGMDVLYIGYNLDMTREFMATVRQWREAFAAGGMTIRLSGKQSESRLKFSSGFAIKALSSHPRSLRGRQGLVIIDEAAFHDDLDALMNAAMALQIWGGKVLVISTHFGQGTAFYRLVNAVLSGEKRYGHLRVTFDDALQQGLYQRIHGLPLQHDDGAAQQRWAQAIRDDYGDAATEELDCIPRQPQGQYFARDLLEASTTTDTPVLRYDHAHSNNTHDWRARTLAVALEALTTVLAGSPVAVGVDFGRHHDLSVMYVLRLEQNLHRTSCLVIELNRTPFVDQWHILQQLLQSLPQVIQVAMDKGGNGSFLHEQAEQYFGARMILGVQLSQGWYSHWMPTLRAAFEAEQISLPRDRQILDDLGQIGLVHNIPKPLPRRHGRHADAAIALALAYQASTASAHLAEVSLGRNRLFTAENGSERLMF